MDIQDLKYFISFIDDNSRYMYIFMLYNKDKSIDAFKAFEAEEVKQQKKQIKIMGTNRGGEYYPMVDILRADKPCVNL